jgi:putative two-component system response regulator
MAGTQAEVQDLLDRSGPQFSFLLVEPSLSSAALLEEERQRDHRFAALTGEVRFEYTLSPAQVTLSSYGAETLNLPRVIANPDHNREIARLVGSAKVQELSDALRSTSPGQNRVTYDCQLNLRGEKRWFRLVCQAIWSEEEPPRYIGAIGSAVDVHDSRQALQDLELQAASDALTGLLNHTSARARIADRLRERPQGKYALALFDLDLFKEVNDQHGHLFGDQVLIQTAQQLRRSIRGGDIVARVGGDEFLLFLEYKASPEPIFRRIFHALCHTVEGYPVSLSMGVAQTETVGNDYDALFRAADNALYAVKRSSRGHFRFYDPSMEETLSVLSPIDEGPESAK